MFRSGMGLGPEQEVDVRCPRTLAKTKGRTPGEVRLLIINVTPGRPLEVFASAHPPRSQQPPRHATSGVRVRLPVGFGSLFAVSRSRGR